MSETFTISFQGGDAISTMISDIEDKIDDLKREGEEEDRSDRPPEIIISSFGAENAIEEFLMDALEEIQAQASDSESDFTGHV